MALTITSIYPTTGPTTGGQTVTITGTDLNTVTSVTFGGTAATSFEKLSAYLIRAVTPAKTAGALNVVISDGTTPQTLTNGYTYAVSSSSEQLTSTLARKWALDVNTGTDVAPVWTRVRAITSLQPALSPTMQDDSDYDSGGWGSDAKTMLKWSVAATIARKKGVTSGNYDPGQEALRTKSDKFGSGGVANIRWYERGGGEAYAGYAQVGWEPQGAGPDGLSTVNITLSGTGERLVITNPEP